MKIFSVVIELGCGRRKASYVMRGIDTEGEPRIVKDFVQTHVVRGMEYRVALAWAAPYPDEDIELLDTWLNNDLMPLLLKEDMGTQQEVGERKWEQRPISWMVSLVDSDVSNEWEIQQRIEEP